MPKRTSIALGSTRLVVGFAHQLDRLVAAQPRDDALPPLERHADDFREERRRVADRGKTVVGEILAPVREQARRGAHFRLPVGPAHRHRRVNRACPRRRPARTIHRRLQQMHHRLPASPVSARARSTAPDAKLSASPPSTRSAATRFAHARRARLRTRRHCLRRSANPARRRMLCSSIRAGGPPAASASSTVRTRSKAASDAVSRAGGPPRRSLLMQCRRPPAPYRCR